MRIKCMDEPFLLCIQSTMSDSKTSSDPASPSPSAQSENSIECGQQHVEPIASTDDDSEQELTNLTWLIQLKNLAAWPDSVNPILDDDIDINKPKNQANILKEETADDRYNKFIENIVKCKKNYDMHEGRFQADTESKPVFNYSQIIAMAMHENGRMTLQQICNWIQRKFAYFRARKNWNNSIRHNLSLNACFRKIDRNKYEKGKGGYWELGLDLTKSMKRKRVRTKNPQRRTNNNIVSNLNDISTQTIMKRQEQQQQQQQPQQQQQQQQQYQYHQSEQQHKRDEYNKTLLMCHDVSQEFINLDENAALNAEIEKTILEIERNEHQQQSIIYNNNNNNNINNNTTNGGGGGAGNVGELHQQITCENSTITSSSGNGQTITTITSAAATTTNQLTDDEFNCCAMRYLTSNDINGVVSSNVEIFEEEFSSGGTTMVDPNTMEIQNHEIYPANEVPSPSENVIISVLNNYPCNGPNVIVEPIPNTIQMDDSYKTYFDGIDEEFQFLRSTEDRDDPLDAFYDISVPDF